MDHIERVRIMTKPTPHLEPGVLHEGIPAEVYHASPGVSNSRLKDFARSPRHYKHALTAPRETTEPQRKGHVFHVCVLEPERYLEGVSHYVRPADSCYYTSDGKFGVTKEAKEWKKAHADLPIISDEERQNFEGARAAILAEPTGELLMSLPARCEVSTWVKHEATGLLLKSRFDRLAEDADGVPWIIDLKSTDDASQFARTCRNFAYPQQAAYYIDNLGRSGAPNARFVFIAVELEPPHGVLICEIGPETLARYRETYETHLARLCECEKLGAWPGYQPADGIKIIELKNWTE